MDPITAVTVFDIFLYLIIQYVTLDIIFDARQRVVVARQSQQECDYNTMLEGDTARYAIWKAFDPEAEWAYPPRVKRLFGIAFILVATALVIAFLIWTSGETFRIPAGVGVGWFLIRYSIINIGVLWVVFGSGKGNARDGTIAGQTTPIDQQYTKIVAALAAAVGNITDRPALDSFAVGYKKELVERYLMNHRDEKISTDEVEAKLDKMLRWPADRMAFVALTNPNLDRRWAAASDPAYNAFFNALGVIRNKNLHNPEFDMRGLFGAVEFNTWTIFMAVVYLFMVAPFLYRSTIGYRMYKLS